MTTPKHTLLPFTTKEGPVFAVVETRRHDSLLYGPRPLNDCIGYLTACRARHYILLSGETEKVCPVPKEDGLTAERQWLKGFALRLLGLPESAFPLKLTVTGEGCIDHCRFTETRTLKVSRTPEGLRLELSLYSGFNGSTEDCSLSLHPDGLPSRHDRKDTATLKRLSVIAPQLERELSETAANTPAKPK